MTSAPIEVGSMSHEQIPQSLSGLLIGMFVAMLSSTVVTNALPTIINDLHGTESGYTCLMAATLLALTATTHIWGRLSDLMSPKLLMQLSSTSAVPPSPAFRRASACSSSPARSRVSAPAV